MHLYIEITIVFQFPYLMNTVFNEYCYFDCVFRDAIVFSFNFIVIRSMLDGSVSQRYILHCDIFIIFS